jgi:hypothetical protein
MSAEPITVWMHPAIVPAFKAWLSLKDMHLAGPMTFERDPDDTTEDVYMVGIGPAPAPARKEQPDAR